MAKPDTAELITALRAAAVGLGFSRMGIANPPQTTSPRTSYET